MASFDGVVLALVKQDFLAMLFVGLGIDVVDVERLQISAGRLQRLQALVDGGITGYTVAVEVRESPLQHGVMVVEATTELARTSLRLKIHHIMSTLESCEMVLLWIGRQDQKKSLIPIVSTRTNGEELLGKGEEASSDEDMIFCSLS